MNDLLSRTSLFNPVDEIADRGERLGGAPLQSVFNDFFENVDNSNCHADASDYIRGVMDSSSFLEPVIEAELVATFICHSKIVAAVTATECRQNMLLYNVGPRLVHVNNLCFIAGVLPRDTQIASPTSTGKKSNTI